MDYESWLTKHRRLWSREDPSFAHKRKEIIKIFNTIAPAFQTEFVPIVFKSHNMNISRMDERRAILCDIHFFDIAQLLASSFYVFPLQKDVKKLTDVLLANSFLCSDDILMAYECAKRFISGPYAATAVMPGSAEHLHIIYSRQMQVSFALAHEMAHEQYQHPSGYHQIICSYMSKRIEELIDVQNRIAEQINNIDLSILRDELIQIPFADAYAYPTPENYQEIIYESFLEFDKLYDQYSDQINLPWEDEREKRMYFVIACQDYLRNKKESIFEKERMIEEATCDIMALIEVLNLQIPNMTRQESINHAVEAYVLCLLVQDMILSAMNIQKNYMDETKEHVDYIRMRLEKEGLLFEEIIALYVTLYPEEEIDWFEVKAKFSQACQIADIMYVEFYEYARSFNFDSVADEYISAFDPEWNTIVSETELYLTLPV